MSKAAPLLLSLSLAGCASGQEPDEGPPLPPPGEEWRDQIIYQVVTDRFDNGDSANDVLDGVAVDPSDLARHQGGDYAGLRRHLDYVEGLGATTIWISPIVDNVDRHGDADGYHGYWASDFSKPNPRFGSLEELRGFVDEVHARKMRVIVDVVLNHTGSVFFYDLDRDGRLGPGESEPSFSQTPYDVPVVWTAERPRLFEQRGDTYFPFDLPDEAFRRQGALEHYQSEQEQQLGDFPSGLRDLNSEDPRIFQALVDTSVYWALASDADGFRFDVVPHMSHEFWYRFASALRKRLSDHGKEKFWLLGEDFDQDPKALASYTTEGMLDSVFDFAFKFGLIDHYVLEGNAAASSTWVFEEAREQYCDVPQPGGIGLSAWEGRVVFADNHDTSRIRSRLDDASAVDVALGLTFTVDGIPAVYYGTEQGFAGAYGHASRERLWDSGFDTSHRTYRFLRELAALRRGSRALRAGSFALAFASQASGTSTAPDAGIMAFERSFEDERLLVVTNAHGGKTSSADIPTQFAAGQRLVVRLASPGFGRTSQTFDVSTNNVVNVMLPARSFVVLGPAEPGRAE